MTKRSLFVSIIPLLLSVSAALAQDKPTFADVFAWFPEGSYSTLAYADILSLKSQDTYPYFKAKFGVSGIKQFEEDNPLNDRLKAEVESISYARINNLKLNKSLLKAANDGELRFIRLLNQIHLTDNSGKTHQIEKTAESSGGKLWVFRFNDTEGLVKRELEAGRISRIRKRIANRPILSLSVKRMEDSQRDFFAWVTPTNELLVAEEKKHLRAMIRAGLGYELSLRDESDYSDLFPFIPELGQSWTIYLDKTFMHDYIDLMWEYGISDQQLETLEECLESRPLYSIKSYVVGRAITDTSIKIYTDEEAAEANVAIINNLNYRVSINISALQNKTSFRANIFIVDDGASTFGNSIPFTRKHGLTTRGLYIAKNLIGNREVKIEGNVVRIITTHSERQIKMFEANRSTAEKLKK